jgi:chromosomal replication initiation ATPase DnaA
VQNAEQLIFDLGHRVALGREDFLIASSNRDATAWIDRWPDWPAPACIVYGPPASGKTHLAEVWKNMSGAQWLASKDLPDCRAEELAGGRAHLVIDGPDPWIGDESVEKTLFHIYNIFKEQGRSLLLTMRSAPGSQPFAIRDLASRLRAAPAAAIAPPDDVLLAAILVKLFNDRQLRVSEDVLRYAVPRMERSFAAARDLVGKVDMVAMQQKREITIPLMRRIMAESGI